MPKMLQVRNLPDDVHEVLRVRAAAAGLSLSDLVARELRRFAESPTVDELAERARSRGGSISLQEAACLVREDRDARS